MTDPLAEFRAATGGGGRPCSIGSALASLTVKRNVLRDALADRTISATAIVKVLGEWGYPVGKGQVEKHRRGECACPK